MTHILILSPDEAIYYDYDPDRDSLTVQLAQQVGPTESEPAPESPLIELQRATHDGRVVALRLKSVQQWLLTTLVRDLAGLLRQFQAAGDGAAEPDAEAVAKRAAPVTEADAVEASADTTVPPEPEEQPKPKRTRRRKTTAEPEAESTETPAEAPTADAEATTVEPEPEPEAKPKRTRRRRKAEPEAEPTELPSETAAPDADATVLEATAEVAAAPEPEEKPKRTRRRRKAEPEPSLTGEPAETATPDAGAVAEPEPDPEAKPKRTRRRRKAEPEAEADADALPDAAPAGSAEESQPTTEDAAETVIPTEADSQDETPEETSSTPRRSRRRRSRSQKGTRDESATDELQLAAAPDELQPAATSEEEQPAPAPDDGEPQAQPPSDAEESSQESSRKRRRRRGGRRRKKKGETAESDSPPPPVASTPAKDGGDGPEEENRPRQAYKTAPISGLGAPEGFDLLNLNPLLGQALMAMGFEEPTPIQRRAVPVGMQGHDVIGLAQTGTGKTVAFLLPALHRLLDRPMKGHRPRMLILTPTRELALQVAEEAEYLATHTDLLITTIYGGVGYKRQLAELKEGTDIIVATPGRLLDHMTRGTARLNGVEVLVLDEADRMLDMGFLPEIRQILRGLPKERQTMLFSATMPPQIQSLSLDFQRQPEVVEVARQLPPATISQAFYPVERHLKEALLLHLLQSDDGMSSVLVFTETKAEADILHRKLQEAEVSVTVMHGDRNQRERERALQSLADGSVRVLVATDVAARGLDVTGISHVVNYDVPQTVDDYVHRIGRTARASAEGHAYTFIATGDEGMASRIEGALDRELPRVAVETFDYDVPTPSWAKPSAEDLIDQINKPKNIADRFRRMMPRRR